jgi:type III restriction enzyme
MKLKFKQQQYQTDATNAVVNCFIGQTKWFRKDIMDRKIIDDNLLGKRIEIEEMFSNKPLEISGEALLQNIQNIQKEWWLLVSKKLEWWNNLTIEMETGTGKTYVYTKTIFELNKQYGWSKFIIMVPSIAIREWVNKSLEITAEHFQELYGKKIRFFIYDTGNKSNLVNIKNFASSSNIEVIVMNYQAFATNSKDSRKIYQSLDSIGSQKPIDIIKWTHPILIIDEPQRFGDKAEATLHEFHPLFTLRYSATHKQEFNKIYRLDAIDAFNQKLVKKINVKGIEVVGNVGTNSFLFLDRINISTNAFPTAHIKMEMEVKQESGIKKVLKKVQEWDNLYDLSNELEQYRWFVVKEINGLNNTVSFTNGVTLRVGQAMWNVDEKHIRRIQIRETIKSHIEKERLMFHKGIKVLSLFFIDEVAKYRNYDEAGNPIPWEYEQIFEEEYHDVLQEQSLFDWEYRKYIDKFHVSDVHNGYFSIDKKWKYIDSVEKKWDGWSDDISAYDLIMKKKEILLSFSEPTRFIFSHSALREWWDNPNVFQICTLKISQSNISKRQEIGRWLRICVNEHGDRMDQHVLESEFFDYNTLTVIASESYETFANDLQKEILDSLSNRPRKLTLDVFKWRVLKNEKWEKFVFDDSSSMNLIFDLKMKWYLDNDYKVTDKCMTDIETEVFVLPSEFVAFQKEIVHVIEDVYSTDNFRAIDDGRADNVNEAILKPNDNFQKKEFQDLWSKINTITSYEVDFDSQELIGNSVDAINTELEVNRVTVSITTGTQRDTIDEASLKSHTSLTKLDKQTKLTANILGNIRYDLIGEIAKNTNLRRETIVAILKAIHPIKFGLFQENPEDFIKKVSKLIEEQKATTLINNITYTKTDQKYSSDIFTLNNFRWSLKENVLRVNKHIYDYVKTDSLVERNFATELEAGEILVYAKLPRGFKISTPIWNYNPDWAIVFDRADVKYIYFIAETKWSLNTLDLKWTEDLKIKYARKHFESLGHANVKYDMIHNFDDLIQKVLK